eukprot:TRINITY_DN68425_c0_g1_i1.p1 TRINITY_DN68425_c0_g1~~TRINITY_DN68425_c0_g1_i1.p1  ORF type:complete len:786 (+),score=125.62 TRINITY_DN68425_c0_g1_i1:51-2408(+)
MAFTRDMSPFARGMPAGVGPHAVASRLPVPPFSARLSSSALGGTIFAGYNSGVGGKPPPPAGSAQWLISTVTSSVGTPASVSAPASIIGPSFSPRQVASPIVVPAFTTTRCAAASGNPSGNFFGCRIEKGHPHAPMGTSSSSSAKPVQRSYSTGTIATRPVTPDSGNLVQRRVSASSFPSQSMQHGPVVVASKAADTESPRFAPWPIAADHRAQGRAVDTLVVPGCTRAISVVGPSIRRTSSPLPTNGGDDIANNCHHNDGSSGSGCPPSVGGYPNKTESSVPGNCNGLHVGTCGEKGLMFSPDVRDAPTGCGNGRVAPRASSAGAVGRLFVATASSQEEARLITVLDTCRDTSQNGTVMASARLAAAAAAACENLELPPCGARAEAAGTGSNKPCRSSINAADEPAASELQKSIMNLQSSPRRTTLGQKRMPRSVGSVVEDAARTKKAPPQAEKRCDFLYREHEMRQRRWLDRFAEKHKHEEKIAKERLKCTVRVRPFNKGSFKNWYDDRLIMYTEACEKRQELHIAEARQRAAEEIAKCSFTPQVTSRSPPSLGRCPSDAVVAKTPGQTKEDHDCLEKIAETLVSAQAKQLEVLRNLDTRKRELEVQAGSDANETVAKMVEKGRCQIERFAKTEEGRDMVAERVREYVELNPGLEEENAAAEAVEDLLQAGEDRVRQQATNALEQRLHADLQLLQLDRLKATRELIRLQKSHEEFMTRYGTDISAPTDFDSSAAERVRHEAWYQEARESAFEILRSELEEAAERGANPPQKRTSSQSPSQGCN